MGTLNKLTSIFAQEPVPFLENDLAASVQGLRFFSLGEVGSTGVSKDFYWMLFPMFYVS